MTDGPAKRAACCWLELWLNSSKIGTVRQQNNDARKRLITRHSELGWLNNQLVSLLPKLKKQNPVFVFYLILSTVPSIAWHFPLPFDFVKYIWSFLIVLAQTKTGRTRRKIKWVDKYVGKKRVGMRERQEDHPWENEENDTIEFTAIEWVRP